MTNADRMRRWRHTTGRSRLTAQQYQAEQSAYWAARRRHGDHAGYVQHQKRAEEACDDCKAGEARYVAERQAGART